MTVTEDVPAAATAPTEPVAVAPAATGLAAVLGAGDHKVVGRLWIIASLAHLVVAGVAAVLTAAERIDTGSLDVLGDDWFAQAFTYRSIGGAFLVLLPLTIGIATSVVPLQVGAFTIAFPRAATAAAWTYLIGSGLVVGAYAIGGGPLGSDSDGVRLFFAAFPLVLLAQVVAWICIVTTVVSLRAPGVRLARTPLFAWSNLVAGAVWLLTLPVLIAITVLTYLDIRYGADGGIFGGGAATAYERIAWAFHPPTVYAFAIPALGVIGSVVPVFAGVRHQRHRTAMGLIGAFGALSVGAWAMPSFGTDRYPWLYELPWIVVSFAVLLPVLGLLGLWALTVKSGRATAGSPMLFAGVAGLMLLVGLLAGAVQSIEPLETLVDGDAATPLFGTTWTSSVASYVVLATATALMGAFVYWAPKIVGRSVAEGAAKGVALLMLLGTILWSFPELLAGLFGQATTPSELIDNESTIEALNIATTAGGAVLALAAAGFVALLLRAAGSEDLPGDDPWGGHTLEWATSSPPPPGNFTTLPEVTSEAPLYDARHRAEEASA
jgi:heme/copper-type cytochrome/quinol oxidase subunit 1